MQRKRQHCRSRAGRRRLEKAYRNYAMEYVRTAAPVAVQVFGPVDAAYLLHLTGKLIGMQYYDETAARLGASRGSMAEFGPFLQALFAAQDDVVELKPAGKGFDKGFELHQQTWKLMSDLSDYHPACTRVLEGLIEGLAAGCGRHIPVALMPGATAAAPLVWSIG